MPVSKEVATWGMRLLLGLEPDGDDIVELHRNGYDSLDALRDNFFRTTEARTLFANANGLSLDDLSSRVSRSRYLIPPFLLRRPAHEDVPWHFAEPSLDEPVSQLCTSEQMATPTYRGLCERIGFDPSNAQRKYWEFAFILAVLESKGMLWPGRKGLGFGTGREPLPSVFAAAGVEVVATDAPADLDFSKDWAHSAQWSEGLADLWHPGLIDRKTFFQRVQFRPADMNNIPAELRGFDFCWSACAFEHLGSIRQGLDYLHRSLEPLKPGGVSVHTTEFNLSSNTKTLETPNLSLFRKQDFEAVIHELVTEGHTVEPLNTWPGALPVDEHVDLPPFSIPHLKLELDGYRTTSFGIVVTKRS